ncbi:prephenate dehydrogenase [Campylobacter fetus]|uniref:prephenate dehydrogenase n=1 Tax=Campylobacter fetus TaxID=196 RepID=UPI0003C25B42|nr:prephenate dehydrogenase [Campylobacter fetus]AGZ82304.1 chorismate mutase / prephenate dehydrogenase [Campylobacter fetus subsp. testudinum 03-427]AJB46027.1 prephenate dehydrogenase [Campylobacter fetus subsp. testudinum]ALV65473.1 chorismate mutase / prephenate dehydrogenase [Campylobacter fetus subsp. testudinum Sp3]EAI4322057.1 prephenate dehydrogenase [Campylobacter fetus]EAI4391691.1 prephenate dehydrogenase [Campylobacter fetus]
MNVGIIGLGLIGGSLGLALRDMKLITKVSGYDLSKENESDALKLGLVDEIIGFEEMKKRCDMIFLAVPVEAIIKILQNLKDIPKSTTIIDLGSTKAEILKSCPDEIKENFVAAHPMAGTENSGPKAAFKTLLNGAVVVVCDDKNAGENHVKRAVEILSHAGMKIVFMDSKSHDHHVGIISHLPHIISYSLVSSTLKEEDKRNILLLAGGSFSGMARIAKSSPQMWLDIFKQNRLNVLNAINSFKNELEICENMIANEQWDELKAWMQTARGLRDIL